MPTMDSFLPLLVSGRTRRRLLSLLLAAVFSLAAIKTGTSILEDFLVVRRDLPRAEALVVMAGSAEERLPVAARLFLDGVAPLILLTNDGNLDAWSKENHRNLYSVEWAEADLVKMKVPAHAIVKLAFTTSGSIHDALNAREEILHEGLHSIVIVTSDYHTRRSLWSFQQVLRNSQVSIGIYPARSKLSQSPEPVKFLGLCLEFTKYLYYRVAYRNIE